MYTRWKFTVLLTTILLLLVVHPLLWGGADLPLLHYAFLAAAMLGVLLALYARTASRIPALVLGVPAFVGLIAIHAVPAAPPLIAAIFLHILPILFIGYAAYTILTILFRGVAVTADDINGAFCGYLPIGIAFAHVYGVVELFRPGSFNLPAYLGAMPENEAARQGVLTYFSLVTLTTVGYGDVTAVSPPARSLACVEAVIGQFYIAVVVAELIGIKLAAAMRDRGSDRPAAPGPS